MIVPKDEILRQLPAYSAGEWAALREYIASTRPTKLQRAKMMYGSVRPLTRSIAKKIVQAPVYMLWADNYWQTQQPYNRVSKPDILVIEDADALDGKAILCDAPDGRRGSMRRYFYYDSDDRAVFADDPVFVFVK